MTIIKQLVHTTNNLWLWCGLSPETIQRTYQCSHKIIHGIWTASVDQLCKYIEARNTDPDIKIILVDTLLYIVGERNDLPQSSNLTLHSKIICIGWTYIHLGFIPKSLACTQQTYFTHIGSRKTGLKWASQLITKIWKLVYSQWLHHSKLKHAGKALDDHTKYLVIDAKITGKHKQVQDTLPYCYNSYFRTPISTISDTSIRTRKLVPPYQDHSIYYKHIWPHNIFRI